MRVAKYACGDPWFVDFVRCVDDLMYSGNPLYEYGHCWVDELYKTKYGVTFRVYCIKPKKTKKKK